MGAIPYRGGTTFRVWAPHADAVFVTGTFDDWAMDATPLGRDSDGTTGTWSADVEGVEAGRRVPVHDPHARRRPLAHRPVRAPGHDSVGNASSTTTPPSTGATTTSQMPGWDDLVIYELHVGTFAGDGRQARHVRRRAQAPAVPPQARRVGRPGHAAVRVRGRHLLGLQPGPPVRDRVLYGGPDAFKRFIRDAHAHGIAVIVDVVYNHLGPSDLDLWRFDGWAEGDGGGIYFYNDERARTPWGMTRPDYGRGEVRTFLRDSALTWLEEFRCDGLRFDATVHIRTVDGPGHAGEIRRRLVVHGLGQRRDPRAPAVEADHRRGPPGRTRARRRRPRRAARASGRSGTRRSSIGVRPALVAGDDRTATWAPSRPAIIGEGRGAPLSRVIYTESHDDVANGQVRVPESITPGDADSWWAKKRAVLGSVLVLTSPGIPMLFQGQELLEDRWFDDTVALDWEKAHSNDGILRLHHDVIALRRTATRTASPAACAGPNLHILRADNEAKVLAYHRWHEGGPHDDTVVVANFADRTIDDLRIGFPAPGRWRVRLNSDSQVYAPEFGAHEAFDLDADGPPMDGCAQSGLVSVGPVLGRRPVARGLTATPG